MFHQLSLGIRSVLVYGLALIIVACSSTQTSSPPVTTMIPSCCTPVPISTVTIVSTPSVEPASIVALTETALACPFEPPGKVPPPQFDEWCNTGCPLRQDQFAVITLSGNAGRCDGVFPRDRNTLSFTFPTWWTVHFVGAFSQNFLFETDKGQEVLLVLKSNTGLPLEQADETKYYVAPDHPYYLVAPEEQRISKEIQTIGDKEALVLVTADGNLSIKRYFVINESTLYMFEIKLPKLNYDDEGNLELFLQVEEIISSMEFVR